NEKQNKDLVTKHAQIEASKKPTTTVQFDANEAMSQLNPALMQHMQGTSDQIAMAVQAMAQAVQGLAAVSQSLEHAAQVMAADNEAVRDSRGKLIGTRKKLPTLQ